MIRYLDAKQMHLQPPTNTPNNYTQPVQPSRAIRNLEHLQLKEGNILTAICGLHDAKQLVRTLQPDEPGLRKECTKMRVVVDFRDALLQLCAAFLARAQAHLCQVAKSGDLFVTSPHIVHAPV